MCFLLTGCGNAAKVNNVSISNKQVDSIMQAQEKLSGKLSEVAQKASRLNVINSLINQDLLVQEAKRKGIKIDSEAIQARTNELTIMWKSGTEVQKSLEAQGFTQDNLKDMAEKQLMIETLTSSGISISDDQLLNYYKTHTYDYSTYTLQKVEGHTEQEANQSMNDPSKFKKITLTFMQLPFTLAQSIRSGQDSTNLPRVVKNNKVYWGVKITNVKTQPYDEVKDQVKKTMLSQLEATNTQDLLAKLRKEAKININ